MCYIKCESTKPLPYTPPMDKQAWETLSILLLESPGDPQNTFVFKSLRSHKKKNS